MSGHLHTTRYMRRKLPHWEVQGGRYFVTVRCVDSLPKPVVDRLSQIHNALSSIPSASEQFAALQRQFFATMEKYLDKGHGRCPLASPSAAHALTSEFVALNEWRVEVPHFSIMPNHWHALITPHDDTHSLAEIIRRVKGRSARVINAIQQRSGALWQAEWFDRWMRNDAEFEKCARYIQHNPVKAGLANATGVHAWTR